MFAEPGSFSTEQEGPDDMLNLCYLHIYVIEDREWDSIIETAALGGGQVVDQTEFSTMGPGLAEQADQLEVVRVVWQVFQADGACNMSCLDKTCEAIHCLKTNVF